MPGLVENDLPPYTPGQPGLATYSLADAEQEDEYDPHEFDHLNHATSKVAEQAPVPVPVASAERNRRRDRRARRTRDRGQSPDLPPPLVDSGAEDAGDAHSAKFEAKWGCFRPGRQLSLASAFSAIRRADDANADTRNFLGPRSTTHDAECVCRGDRYTVAKAKGQLCTGCGQIVKHGRQMYR